MSGTGRPIRFDEVRAWLFEAAWPFWAEHGVDRTHGGFVEHLGLDGRDGLAHFKRTRAQARQIFCFSQAALLGWEPGRAASDHGWRFLTEHGRLAEGRWARRMGRDGGVLDATLDAYDVAFVLYAHAWRFRLTRDPSIVESAMATLDALDRDLGRPEGPGWFADAAREHPFQQNPHMHVMEALVELALATGDARFKARARALYAFALEQLFERDSGVLREFFDAHWRPVADARGSIVEPGHQMEWVWILYRGRDLLGTNVAEVAGPMFAFAERHGVHPTTGLTYDQVVPEGDVLVGHHRSWPQTEALKANLAMLEHEGADRRARIAVCVDNLLDRYLAATPRGTWVDHVTSDHRPMVDRIPSTTLYHVQLAFAELLRLRPHIEAMGAGAGA